VPPKLGQSHSAVKVAQARLMQVASQLGSTQSFDSTPQQMIDEFYKRSGRVHSPLAVGPTIRVDERLLEAHLDLPEGRLGSRYISTYRKILAGEAVPSMYCAPPTQSDQTMIHHQLFKLFDV